jgi:hypothetical protein
MGTESDRTADEVSIRRAPRIGRFVFLGAALGALGALVCTSVFPVDPAVGFSAMFGYLVLYGIPAGALVGAIVAVVLDLSASRHSSRVIAGKMTVQAQLGADGLEATDGAPEPEAADAQEPDAHGLDADRRSALRPIPERPRSDTGQG